MASIKELIRSEADQSLSFGDYERPEKGKKADFEFQGDIYEIKTFCEITKLERNGAFTYESVPGTVVTEFRLTDDGMEFTAEGPEDAQITVGLEPDSEYSVRENGQDLGIMETNLGGKLVFSLELSQGKKTIQLVKQ